MNGSKKELEERVAAAEKLLRDLETSLEATRRMISEARLILDGAKDPPPADTGTGTTPR